MCCVSSENFLGEFLARVGSVDGYETAKWFELDARIGDVRYASNGSAWCDEYCVVRIATRNRTIWAGVVVTS